MPRIDGKVLEADSLRIHNVHILDSSGSMQGDKYSNAIAGINSETEELKTSNGDFTQTIIEFDAQSYRDKVEGKWIIEDNLTRDINIMPHYFMVPLTKVTAITGYGAKGTTPLLQTVGRVIEALINAKAAEDRVVVKIFTDGQHNVEGGRYSTPKEVGDLIKKAEKEYNFTVAFVGTDKEVLFAQRDLGLSHWNTLVHDNTAKGIGQTYKVMSMATESYNNDVKTRGLKTSSTFFKTTKTDGNES